MSAKRPASKKVVRVSAKVIKAFREGLEIRKANHWLAGPLLLMANNHRENAGSTHSRASRRKNCFSFATPWSIPWPALLRTLFARALKAARLRLSACIRPMPDRDAYDRDFALSLLSQEQDALYEIDQALKRIEARHLRQCAKCRANHIPHARSKQSRSRVSPSNANRSSRSKTKLLASANRSTSLFGLTDEEGGEGRGRRSRASRGERISPNGAGNYHSRMH